MNLAGASRQFEPDGCYLNTATVGIPTVAGVAAMTNDVAAWGAGRLNPPDYDDVVHRARAAFGRIIRVDAQQVGIVSQLSVATAVAASALTVGDRVLVAEEDFTSVLFPILQCRNTGVIVDAVPLDDLIDRISAETTMVAVSAAQSADGRVIDLDALADAAAAHDVLTFIDATQAAGWLPIDGTRFSMVAAAGYKWLCSPRGTGFIAVDPAVSERFTPVAAGWYAGADVWSSIYGPPLRLARDGRRFDTSPAWSCWAGALPSLELLAEVGPIAIRDHNVHLANRALEALGQPPSDSAIISVDLSNALETMLAAGVSCAGRGGRTRMSFHLYNTEADVDRVLDLIG